MGVIPLLVVCSVLFASLFLLAFLWANRHGQYDDLQTPAIRVLFEDRRIHSDALVNPDALNSSLLKTQRIPGHANRETDTHY